jgi:hypothetical protein
MAAYRRYTKRQKATAVIAAEMVNIAAAAEQAGIPESTIRRRMDDPDLADLRSKTREDLAEQAHLLVQLAAEAIQRRLPEFEPRDLTILYGVMMDKKLLLTGQATARTETRILTAALDDHEKQALRDAIDRILHPELVPA